MIRNLFNFSSKQITSKSSQSPVKIQKNYVNFFDKSSSQYSKFQFSELGLFLKGNQNQGQGNYNYGKYFNEQQMGLAMFALPFFVIINQKLSKKVNCFFGSSITRNKVEGRAITLQYAANNPIEDRVMVKQLTAIDGYVLEVYDGHGGWQVSQFVQENLNKELNRILEENKKKKYETDDDYIKESISQTFDILEQKFYNVAKEAYAMGFPGVSRVGSCALVSVVYNNKIFAANIGDCKGVIVSQEDKQFYTRKINHKFNANSKKEQARLKALFKSEADIVVCKGSSDACYVKGRLQPTRAFGDLQLKHAEFNNPQNQPIDKGYPRKIPNYSGSYITHTPDIKVFELNQNDKYLVMATDGLWDELNKYDVASIVGANVDNKTEIINQLFKQAFAKAAKSSNKTEEELYAMQAGPRRNYHDDISIIVLDLQNQFKN